MQQTAQDLAPQIRPSIVIQDETLDEIEKSNPQLPQEDAKEKFKKAREISSSSESKLSDNEKNILEALLGFGLAEKKVDLWKDNVKYTFIIKNFDDELLREHTKARIELDEYFKSISDSINSQEEKAKTGVDFIFETRILTLSYAIQEIFIGEPLNKKISKEKIVESLGVPDFRYLLRTWGETPVKILFEAFSELNKEISDSILNESKLIDHLKK